MFYLTGNETLIGAVSEEGILFWIYRNFLKKGSDFVLQHVKKRSLSESIKTYFYANTTTECYCFGNFFVVQLSLKNLLISFNLIFCC